MNKLVIKKEDYIYNIDKIKEYIDKSGIDDNGNKTQIIAVVKGNSYGMGIIESTKILVDNGITFFAVATKEEAVLLRKSGIKEKILMLSPTSIEYDVKELIENEIIITIGSKEDIKIAEELGKELNKKVIAHLKIDTGFGRYGFVYSEILENIEILKGLSNIEIQGTFSHYSNSYYDEKYTKEQFDRFLEVVKILKKNEINVGMLHICNSSAALTIPLHHLNAVRIGSAFFGRLSCKNTLGLRKVGEFKSQVAEIKILPKGFNIGYSNTYKTKRETKIAVVPVGYMNGFNVVNNKDMFRFVDKLRYIKDEMTKIFKKQKIHVKINNQNCEVLGRIGTYHIVLDIIDKKVEIGDEVKLDINPKFIDSSIRREYL